MKEAKILIVDFGSQYTQLIARRIRELGVYSEIIYPEDVEVTKEIKGIILAGSPFSVNQKDRPIFDFKILDKSITLNIPIFGICYGAQLIAKLNRGKVVSSKIREYGRSNLSHIAENSVLFSGVKHNSQVWMSHGDTIVNLPKAGKIIASTKDVKIAGYFLEDKNTYGVQFHPEVYHSTDGMKIISNFIFKICKCKKSWTPKGFVDNAIKEIKEKVGNEKVILGLSGGVDSTVAAILIKKAIGKNLYCIFVNNGLLRKNEFANVLKSYKKMGLNIKGVDANKIFLKELENISDPEQKRKIIGKIFIEVFDEESKKIKNIKWLGQGTIYPDIIESSKKGKHSQTIKSHHNVGGLPDYMKLKLLEPLNTLFKDEVRKVGNELKINEEILNRHPFPGPGLAVRILGEITDEKISILREADNVFIDLLKEKKLYQKVWQACTILLPVKSVGVMGDERKYGYTIVLRAVESVDGMTADWVHLPYDFLALISNEIVNKVKGVTRVVYDISSKPPATIEWE